MLMPTSHPLTSLTLLLSQSLSRSLRSVSWHPIGKNCTSYPLIPNHRLFRQASLP